MTEDLIKPRAEVFATVLKAARGAGWPLAQSEDFARTMAARINPKCLEDFVAILRLPIAARVQKRAYQVFGHPVLAWPAATDLVVAERAPIEVEPHAAPNLLAAFVAQMALDNECALNFAPTGTMIRIARRDGLIDPAETGAVHVDADMWAQIEDFAAKTYVPNSEASRAAGAGAGLTDND